MATLADYMRLEAWIDFQLNTDDSRVLSQAQRGGWQRVSGFNINHNDIESEISRLQAHPEVQKTFYRDVGEKLVKQIERNDPRADTTPLRRYIVEPARAGTLREESLRRLFRNEFRIVDDSVSIKSRVKEENRLEKQAAAVITDTFAKLEKEIQLAPDQTREDIQNLNQLKATIKSVPVEQIGSKNKKELLARIEFKKQNILAGLEGVGVNDVFDKIVGNIRGAGTPSELKIQERDINLITDKEIKDQLKREFYQKKLELGMKVDKGTAYQYFGDIDEKIQKMKDSYGEDYFDIKSRKVWSAYGFTEDEIKYIQYYKGKEPRIEVIDRSRVNPGRIPIPKLD